jgi:hypothetical protein
MDELALRAGGSGLGNREAAHFDAVDSQVGRLDVNFQMRKPGGQMRFDARADFLFDAEEQLVIPDRRSR